MQRALYIHKRAWCIRKRVLLLRKRAQYIHKSVPRIYKRVVCIRKRAQYICKRALLLRKRDLQLPQWAQYIHKSAPRMHKRVVCMRKRAPSIRTANEPYISLYLHKEPCISAKEPYVSANVPNISAKEHYIRAKRPTDTPTKYTHTQRHTNSQIHGTYPHIKKISLALARARILSRSLFLSLSPSHFWHSPHQPTAWRRLIGCLKLKVIFRKRATNHRSLLRKMTYEDKAPYDSTPPCMGWLQWVGSFKL